MASSANSNTVPPLQLCRPYSGAVIRAAGAWGADNAAASIVPPFAFGQGRLLPACAGEMSQNATLQLCRGFPRPNHYQSSAYSTRICYNSVMLREPAVSPGASPTTVVAQGGGARSPVLAWCLSSYAGCAGGRCQARFPAWRAGSVELKYTGNFLVVKRLDEAKCY